MRYLVKRIPSTSLVQYDGSRYYCEIAGGTAEKSTVDTTGLLAGSKYLDVQTGTWYVYDELTNAWAVSAEGGSADPAVVEAAVEAWLDAHPEATTTVQDGSISYAKLDSTLKGKADAVTSLSDEIEPLKHVYGKSKPIVILMPEFASDFWFANFIPNALYGKQTVFTVSGSAGDRFVTVSATTPDTVTPATVTQLTGFVLTTDEETYEPYNVIYDSAEGKLSVYPALSRNVENGKLCQFYLDGGASYTAMHLTEYGFKAYATNLYNKNPKHCEVGLYNAKYDSLTDTASHPFSKFNSSPLYIERVGHSQSGGYLQNYFSTVLNVTFSNSYTPYDHKNGVYWEQALNGTSGYLELILNAKPYEVIELPSDQYVYVDVYIDGIIKSHTEIKDTIGRRICVDYEKATTGKVEIYANKWSSIEGYGSGFGISKCVWWINQIDYPANAKLFPTGAFVAQEFDSWGVFNDGITGTTLQELISADAGVTVPLENHSLGSQTSAWGLAYWYQNILAYHPQIAITDFLINDNNSVSSGNIPATITGPDGKTYNNKITKEMYAQNMKKLATFALNNNIQPIMMRNCQQWYFAFPDAAIEYISQQYTP